MTKFELLDGEPDNSRRLLEEFADFLRQHPGRWGKWPTAITYASSVPSHIRRGRFKALPGDQFEARVLKRVAYVRYIGKES